MCLFAVGGVIPCWDELPAFFFNPQKKEAMYEKTAPMTKDPALRQEMTGRVYQDSDSDLARKPEIEAAITRLSSLVNSLAAKMESLESRLHPVLSNRPPHCENKSPSEVFGSCPLADELRSLANKIEQDLMRLAAIEERIEL